MWDYSHPRTESYVRRFAKRHGYRLHKPRNRDGYALLDEEESWIEIEGKYLNNLETIVNYIVKEYIRQTEERRQTAYANLQLTLLR